MNRYFQPSCMPESNAPFSQVVIDDIYAHLAGIVAADFPEGQLVVGDVVVVFVVVVIVVAVAAVIVAAAVVVIVAVATVVVVAILFFGHADFVPAIVAPRRVACSLHL